MVRFTSGHAERTTRWVTARPLARSTYTVCYRTNQKLNTRKKVLGRSPNVLATTLAKFLVRSRFLVNAQANGTHALHAGASLVVSESARSLSSGFPTP